MKKICVFASGTGSNFQAIYEAVNNGFLDCEIALLVSDKPKSLAVEKASKYGIDTFTFVPKNYVTKTEYEQVILDELQKRDVELIVLAGYMRLIGSTLLKEYRKKILNIHPSLLPLFKGKDAVGQAMRADVLKTGVTVHYVDEGMDTGEIIDQEELSLNGLNTRGEIENEIHEIEHKLYPKVIRQILEEKR